MKINMSTQNAISRLTTCNNRNFKCKGCKYDGNICGILEVNKLAIKALEVYEHIHKDLQGDVWFDDGIEEHIHNLDELEQYDTDDDDYCYECTGYGDDYTIGEDGELVCNCDDCPHNESNWEDGYWRDDI